MEVRAFDRWLYSPTLTGAFHTVRGLGHGTTVTGQRAAFTSRAASEPMNR